MIRNPSTQAKPFLTITKAAKMASAGATVVVEAGKYNQHVQLSVSGASGAPKDPLFVNPVSDFHLQAGSPCIDQGLSLPQVTHDYDGISRPQGKGYDMGAYEKH